MKKPKEMRTVEGFATPEEYSRLLEMLRDPLFRLVREGLVFQYEFRKARDCKNEPTRTEAEESVLEAWRRYKEALREFPKDRMYKGFEILSWDGIMSRDYQRIPYGN